MSGHGFATRAIHDGQPNGIRLLPDPNFAPVFTSTGLNQYTTLAYDRVVPIGPPPDYNEGFCTPTVANTPIMPPRISVFDNSTPR